MKSAEWVESPGQPGRAHLFDEDERAWCGVWVGTWALPYAPRCKSCLLVLQKFYEKANMEPPMRVVTVLTIEVEHNASETADSVLTTALRRVRPPAATSWEVHGDITSSQPKGEGK